MALEYLLGVQRDKRPSLEVEMRFVCAPNVVPWSLLRALDGYIEKDAYVFQEIHRLTENVRTRIRQSDGAEEHVIKQQLKRYFDTVCDRYIHVNKESLTTAPISTLPTTTTTSHLKEQRRISFVAKQPAEPRIDVTSSHNDNGDSDVVLELECAPFAPDDDKEMVKTKYNAFMHMCRVVHKMLGQPLGTFTQEMPVALARSKINKAVGKEYVLSHKVDGVRRLIELRMHMTRSKAGRRASAHIYASRTMTLMHHDADIASRLGLLLPESVEKEMIAKGVVDIHLMIDAELIGRTLYIIDLKDSKQQRESDTLMMRMRHVRAWLPILCGLFVERFYDNIKPKAYFVEPILKQRCIDTLESSLLQDGLIFTPNYHQQHTIYKWKEARQSTIDLLYDHGDLLATSDTSRFSSILLHFPSSFTIDTASIQTHNAQNGDILECRIDDNDTIACIGIRRDKVYPNRLMTCMHTLKVVKEKITMDEIITHLAHGSSSSKK